MSANLDGLAAMRERREQQASRGAPPPRHPRPGASVPTAGSAPDAEATSGDAEAEQDSTRAARPGEKPRQKRDRAPTATGGQRPAEPTSLRAAQFYIDQRCDDYLDEIRIEAIRRKVDVSASAVVRLAIHRLAEELSPGEVAGRLAVPVSERTGSGRKRH